jgi:DNA-binding CsgD family transcriptional regulator
VTVPSAASELRTALALAAGNEAGIGKTGLAIRLTELDVPPIFAHVLPLTGSDFRTRLRPRGRCGRVHRCAAGRARWRRRRGSRLGLTPAETRLLASLFGGLTLTETAATLGITRPTAKTHLEHIFLKTAG